MKNKLDHLFENPRKRIIIEMAAAAIIIGSILSMVFSDRNVPTKDLKEGVDYIKSLENADTAPVEKALKEIKKAERKTALENGELDVWQQFNDSAILGDSRAAEFSYYGFLDESRVLAEIGATTLDIPDYINSLKTLNPSNIFLCFGINDISIEYWNSVDEYLKELDQMIGKLRETLPDSTIYINSIIPVKDIPDASSKWNNVPVWNDAIKNYCLEKDIPYIDLTETVNKHKDLYDADGLHMTKSFYTYWAIDMITEINEHE